MNFRDYANLTIKNLLGLSVILIGLLSERAEAQWLNDNIAREFARPGGPILCRPIRKALLERQQFIEGLLEQNRDKLKLARRTVDLTKDTLSAMQDAHYVSDVAEVVSSVAGLAAGGMAIRSLYFAGRSVTFAGLTVAPGTVGAHAYSAYALASNGWPLAKLGFEALSDEKTPDELLKEQMAEYRRQGLMSRDAVKFLTLPSWSGSSELLDSPLVEGAFTRLFEFYEKEKKKIGYKESFWQSLGEFWHEKGLRQDTLNYAVAKETLILQDMRVKYQEMLISFIRQHREYCYNSDLDYED